MVEGKEGKWNDVFCSFYPLKTWREKSLKTTEKSSHLSLCFISVRIFSWFLNRSFCSLKTWKMLIVSHINCFSILLFYSTWTSIFHLTAERNEGKKRGCFFTCRNKIIKWRMKVRILSREYSLSLSITSFPFPPKVHSLIQKSQKLRKR